MPLASINALLTYAERTATHLDDECQAVREWIAQQVLPADSFPKIELPPQSDNYGVK